MRRHVAGCARCTAELDAMDGAVALLGVTESVRPPPSLRSRVLSEMRQRRWDPARIQTELVDPYLLQVEVLDDLLGNLTPAQWRTPIPRHGDIAGLMKHLNGNDAMVLSDLADRGSRQPTIVSMTPNGTQPLAMHERWRAQASRLVTQVSAAAQAELERPVRLAGRVPVHRSLRESMVQRAFETWTHADDIRVGLDISETARPPSSHLRSIVELALTLLPSAMTAARRDHPGQVALLHLTDTHEEGEWRLLLSERSADPDAPPAVTIHTDLTGFCQLVASRRTRHDLAMAVIGDRRLAIDLLEVAVTLGCDGP